MPAPIYKRDQRCQSPRVHLTKDVWKWALLCRLLFGWMVRLWTRWPGIEHVYISTTNISTTKIIPTKTHVYVTYGMKRLADSFRISPRLPQLAIQLPQLGVWACHLLQSCPMVVPELNLSSQKFSKIRLCFRELDQVMVNRKMASMIFQNPHLPLAKQVSLTRRWRHTSGHLKLKSPGF